MNYQTVLNQNVIVSIIDSGYFECKGFCEENIIEKYNAIDDSNNVNDNNGHGTSMLSLLIGFEYNNVKIEGINPKAKVIIVKAIGDDGKAKPDVIAKSIIYSVDKGANIINISMGSRLPNTELEKAVDYASSKGVYIIASAGDMGNSDALYPARYSNAIAIQAQAKSGEKYIYANDIKGKYLKIPGVEIDVASYDYEQKKWFCDQRNGSSISSIIFSGLLSTICEGKIDADFDYLYDVNSYIFLDYNKMR